MGNEVSTVAIVENRRTMSDAVVTVIELTEEPSAAEKSR